MPKRNRVAPNGNIIAPPARGTFMGNRSYGTRWLVCDLHFERELLVPRVYEKLFFLDEAVALAAGHRPCSTCRHRAYKAFLAAFGATRAGDLDRPLNAPRSLAPLRTLPDGAFVVFGSGDFRLIWRGALHRWTPAGYTDTTPLDGHTEAVVLTPTPTLHALRNGYEVMVHRSAG